MSYVAFYYRAGDGAACARRLRRGFACTTAELPREIATVCRADRNRSVEWLRVADAEHAQVLLDAAAARGLVIEPSWPQR